MSDQGMDLKTFIQTTLVQIVQGTEAAITEIAKMDSNAKVNPFASHGSYSDPKDVDFDVAVTVTDEKSGGGDAGIAVAMFRFGAKGEVKLESQAVSRIRFSIPVAVPGIAVEQYPTASQYTSHAYDPYSSERD